MRTHFIVEACRRQMSDPPARTCVRGTCARGRPGASPRPISAFWPRSGWARSAFTACGWPSSRPATNCARSASRWARGWTPCGSGVNVRSGGCGKRLDKIPPHRLPALIHPWSTRRRGKGGRYPFTLYTNRLIKQPGTPCGVSLAAVQTMSPLPTHNVRSWEETVTHPWNGAQPFR
jgi:hypothetical protein